MFDKIPFPLYHRRSKDVSPDQRKEKGKQGMFDKTPFQSGDQHNPNW